MRDSWKFTLMLALALLLPAARVRAEARALIVNAPLPSTMALATAQVRNMLILRGLAVDISDVLPADPSAYCCIWDLRFATPLTVVELDTYLAFIANGHGLVFIGENPACCRDRNGTIDTFLRSWADGGNVRIADPDDISGTSVEQVNPGHVIGNEPTPISQVTWDGSAAGVFQNYGNGMPLTSRSAVPRTVAAVWNEGTLAAAPGGRVVVVNDFNWLVETIGQTDNRGFLDNIGSFICPSVDASLLVTIATPGGFVRECPATLSITGIVDGADATCVQPTTAAGPIVTEIAVSLNGGPFLPVTSSTPPLPAPPPVEFTASNLPLVLGSNTITVRARDGGLLEAGASIVGEMRDSVAPRFDPAGCLDVVVSLDGACAASFAAVPSVTDACDSSPLVTANPALPIRFSGPSSTSVSYTAEDDAGNRANCARTVSAEDLGAPSLTCSAAQTLECSAQGGNLATDVEIVAWLAATTASDNCSIASLLNDAPALFPSACPPGRGTRVTWDATDGSGNPASCSAVLTVSDTQAPVVSKTPTPLTLECRVAGGVPASDSAVANWRAGFAATDICGTANLSDTVPALLAAGCAPGLETAVTFTARDDCGNAVSAASTVTVLDSTPPTLAVPAAWQLECSSPGGVLRTRAELVAWLGSATAADVCGSASLGNDAPVLVPSGCAPGRSTSVVFTALDGCANPAVKSATVTVQDTTAPILATPASMTLECNATGGVPRSDPQVQAWLAAATAADICASAAITHNAPLLIPAGCASGLLTPVNFIATDDCGNAVSGASSLTVTDGTAPNLSVPGSITLECSGANGIPKSDPAIAAWLAAAAASDVCDGATLSNDAPALFPSGCGAGASTLVTFSAVDNCGNVTTRAATVTVRDTTAPALTVPAPAGFECTAPGGTPRSDPDIQAWLAAATASDVCDGAAIGHDAPAFFPDGCAPGRATDVSFAATDNCGNTAVASSSVAIQDTTPPVIGEIAFDGICLWPPNHHYHCIDDVAADVIATDVCATTEPTIRVQSCISSQPQNSNGDGNTGPDCAISDDRRGFCVRAERDGSDPAGRFYVLTVAAIDDCGNSATKQAVLHVPHDGSAGDSCRRPNRGK